MGKGPSFQEILKDILQKNINLLNSRTELEEQLEARISGPMRRDFNTVRLAMQANIGGLFLSGVSAPFEEKEKILLQVREALTAQSLQPQRIDFVIDAFKYALNWPEHGTDLSSVLANAAPEAVTEEESVAAEAAVPAASAADVSQLAPEFQRLAANAANMANQPANAGNAANMTNGVNTANRANQTAGIPLANMSYQAGPFPPRQVPPRPAAPAAFAGSKAPSWTCVCGKINTGNFCTRCGHTRIVNQTRQFWTCHCGKMNDGDFCTQCGQRKPAVSVPPGSWVCPVCYKVNKGSGKFCTKCGTKRNF